MSKREFLKIAYAAIYGFIFIVLFSGALLIRPAPVGEADDYMIVTIALQKHFSDEIRASDVQQAFIQYPDFKRYWEEFAKGNFWIKSGDKNYTAYFPTYSALVLPIVLLYKILEFAPASAFAFANALYFFLALLLVQKFKVNNVLKIITIVTLATSPIIFYICWPSAEMVIGSLVVASLICVFSGYYKSSMLFYALASTLNITISPFCLYIYYCFYKNGISKNSEVKRIDKFFKIYYKEIIKLCFINLIVLIPVSVNLHRFGKIVTMEEYSSYAGIWSRLGAYLTDLNFGILPFYPLLFVILPLVLVATSKKLDFFIFICIVLLIFISFSLHVHINCEMTGIHRYLAWGIIFFIVGAIYFANYIIPHKFRIIIEILLIVSCCYTASIVFVYHHLNARHSVLSQYITFNPVARLVLDYKPGLYNPLPSTFASRTTHLDGGYDFKMHLPLIYYDDGGNPRKALVDMDTLSNLSDRLIAAPKDEAKVKSALSEVARSCEADGAGYFNFPAGVRLMPQEIEPGKVYHFTRGSQALRYLTGGWLYPEADGQTRSIGDASIISFLRPDILPGSVTLELTPLDADNGATRLSVFVNDEFVKTFNVVKPEKISFALPAAERRIQIRLCYDTPVLPKKIWRNKYTDDRRIFFALKSLLVE